MDGQMRARGDLDGQDGLGVTLNGGDLPEVVSTVAIAARGRGGLKRRRRS